MRINYGTQTSSRVPLIACSGATPGGTTRRLIEIPVTGVEEIGLDEGGLIGGIAFGISLFTGCTGAGEAGSVLGDAFGAVSIGLDGI